MNGETKNLRLNKCPICHGDLKITTIKCENCGIELKNDFNMSTFDRLSDEDYNFLIEFLKSRGNLKELQTNLGISYPFAKKKLDKLLFNLGIESNTVGEAEKTDMNNIITDYNSTKASEIVKCKLKDSGGAANFHTYDGIEHTLKFVSDCNKFISDAANEIFTFDIFDVVVDFLIANGGKARKGDAQNHKVGEPKCDLTTVAGNIGKRYFHKLDGESCLNPTFIVSGILEWAGIVNNRRGYIELTQEFKSKIYL